MMSLTQRELAREIRLRRRVHRVSAVAFAMAVACAVLMSFAGVSTAGVLAASAALACGAVAGDYATRLFMFGATDKEEWLR